LHYFTLTFDDTPLIRMTRTAQPCDHGEELVEALQGCLRLLGPVDRAHSALLVDVRQAPQASDEAALEPTKELFINSVSPGWGAHALVLRGEADAPAPGHHVGQVDLPFESFTDVAEAETFLDRALEGLGRRRGG
jgi:hypothetical protein